jgi:hypothetical protein
MAAFWTGWREVNTANDSTMTLDNGSVIHRMAIFAGRMVARRIEWEDAQQMR